MKIQHQVKLLSKKELAANCFWLEFLAPDLAEQAKPGQFVQLEVPQFLKRPFGVAAVDHAKGSFSVGIRVFGAGTRALAELSEGAEMTVVGPLGHGFTIQPGEKRILVGGGSGIFPLLYLWEHLRLAGEIPKVYFGFRECSEICLPEAFLQRPELTVATDVGDFGFHGHAVAALMADSQAGGPSTRLLACGPLPMLRAASAYAGEKRWQQELSLEARMACGLGLCLCCSIPLWDDETREHYHYERCCYEGPVFPGERLAFEHLS